jgi:predicted SprT family Zn-dependent metalloprotease
MAGPFFEVCLSVGDASEFPKPRNMAYTNHDDDTGDMLIVVAPKLLHGDHERIEGVLRHEFGHALLFFWGQDSHGERDADTVAERVFGAPIYYDRETVQTLRGGTRPRPSYLGL